MLAMIVHTLNPLLYEFFRLHVFEKQPKIGSYRLPTYRCCTHRNFFDYPFLFWNLNFGHPYSIVTAMQQPLLYLMYYTSSIIYLMHTANIILDLIWFRLLNFRFKSRFNFRLDLHLCCMSFFVVFGDLA